MVLASSYVSHVLWNSNTLRLSELAVHRTPRVRAPTVLVGRCGCSSGRSPGRSRDGRSLGSWGATRQRFTKLEVPEARHGVSVRRLFGVEVLEALEGAGS
jgi:hypothetical protein